MTHFRRFVVAMCLLTPALAAFAQEAPGWHRFRGPNGAGVGDGLPLPAGFDVESARWIAPAPDGRSSPVVGHEHVFLTGVDDGVLVVTALRRDDGQAAWEHRIEPGYDVEMYPENDSASPTPVTDGVNVYALFGTFGVVALDGAGQERWRLPLGPFDNFYGTAASPVLAGDTLILLFDQVRGSYLLGVDVATGQERWRRERPGRVESWTTPVLYPADAPTQVIVFGSGHVDAYDLDTGEPYWDAGDVGPLPVASPVLAGDLLIASSPDQAEYLPGTYDSLLSSGDADGSGGIDYEELLGIDAMQGWGPHFSWLDGDGDGVMEREEYDGIVATTQTASGTVGLRLPAPGEDGVEVLWREVRAVPYLASPVVYGHLAYLVTDNGILTALAVDSGQLVRRDRLSRSGANLAASPVAGDGKLYFATRGGEVFVVRAGEDWEVVAVNDLGEPMLATPAIAGGTLYVRTSRHLYAFSNPDSDERP